jgi:hypothetical protein
MEILAEDTLRPRISICKEKWGAAGSQTLAFAPPCDPTYSDGIATESRVDRRAEETNQGAFVINSVQDHCADTVRVIDRLKQLGGHGALR